MLEKRIKATRLLDRLGVLRAATAIAGRSRRGVTIFAYHRILDVANEPAFESDLELVTAGTAAFEAQMRFIRDNFAPTTFRELLALRDAGSPPPAGTAIVTFDDGFGDNYTNAYPILRRTGVPATIFLSTGIIDSQRRYWFEAVARRLLTARDDLELPNGRRLGSQAGDGVRRTELAQLLRYLKKVPEDVRVENVSRLLAGAPGGDDCPTGDVHGPLTWAQVAEMAANGIEFGSHTVSHPVLARVGDEQLRHELFASKARIEEMTHRPVQVLSYPVGGAEAFDERVRRIAREAGYAAAVAYIPGGNHFSTCDWFALRRVRVERYVPIELFRAMSAMPGVFAL